MPIFESEPNNTLQQANLAALGQTVNGQFLANADRDFFRLPLPQGGTLTLELSHPDGLGTSGRGIQLQLMSADGAVINGKTFAGSGKLEATLPRAGDYYFVVSDNDGSSVRFAEGVYSVTTSLGTDPNSAYDGATNNSLDTAIATLADGITPITAGASLTGSLGDNNDKDFFQLNTDAGGALTLDFVHPNGTGTSGRGIQVQLMSGDGAVINSKTFTGNGTLEATLPRAGDYYVVISDDDGSSVRFAEGVYSVTTSLDTDPNSAYDGANNNWADTAIATLADGITPITAGARLAGSLGDNNDKDFFRLNTDSGGALSLDFVHPNGMGTSGRGIQVQLMSADGAAINSNTFAGSGKLEATLPRAGDYYVVISDDDGSSVRFAEGVYSVISSLDTDPSSAYDGASNDRLDTAIATLADGLTPIVAGARLNGSLGANNDKDFFRFNTDAGGALSLDFVHPNGVGTNGRGIQVQLMSGEGAVIGSKIFAGNGKLDATLPRAGDYYAVISDNDGSSVRFAEGIYSITIKQESNLLSGTNANDLLRATVSHERILGLEGNDTIRGGSGYNLIDGGGGTDTVLYDGLLAHYWISGSEGQVRVMDQFLLNGNDGIDDLVNVERLRFMDKSLAFDISDTGGKAYRLYQAAFDRTPDEAGVGYWIAQMDAGASLFEVAGHFMTSLEFRTMYGDDLSNADFVKQLYLNVLDRQPDSDGLAYWVSAIDSAQASRAATLAYFSESAENQSNVIETIGGGFAYLEWLG